jgi:hypothetical protein
LQASHIKRLGRLFSSRTIDLMNVKYTVSHIINFFIYIFAGKQLMLRVAEMVPKHHGRTKKQETASTSTTTAGPSNKSGKGGKKRR